jgi:hypothetical protein
MMLRRSSRRESRSSRINRALPENDRSPSRRVHLSDNRPASRMVSESAARSRILDLLLQRAPGDASSLHQKLDGSLVKAPHEDRGHPVFLRGRLSWVD